MLDVWDGAVINKEIGGKYGEDFLPLLKEWLIGWIKKAGVVAQRQFERLENYTRQHSNRVWLYVMGDFELLVDPLRLPNDSRIKQALMLGGQLHDLGKAQIPDKILSKPGQLTDEERDVLKEHSQIGYDVVKNILFRWLEIEETFDLKNYIGHREAILTKPQLRRMVLNMVLFHHEKIDGTGYPFGLKGSEIPLEAIMTTLVDVMGTILDARPYKKAEPMTSYIAELQKGLGTYFSRKIGKIILDNLLGSDPIFCETSRVITSFKWELYLNPFLFYEEDEKRYPSEMYRKGVN